jgi:hypothetical protein
MPTVFEVSNSGVSGVVGAADVCLVARSRLSQKELAGTLPMKLQFDACAFGPASFLPSAPGQGILLFPGNECFAVAAIN